MHLFKNTYLRRKIPTQRILGDQISYSAAFDNLLKSRLKSFEKDTETIGDRVEEKKKIEFKHNQEETEEEKETKNLSEYDACEEEQLQSDDSSLKPSVRRNLSIGAPSSISKNFEEEEKGNISEEDETIHIDNMKNYDLYKNNRDAEEYINNLKAKNMFFRNEEKKKEEENNGKELLFGNVNYKDAYGTTNESILRGNIRYNSATTSEFPKNSNPNRMNMNLLYNNNFEKNNADIAGFNEANKRKDMNDNYKNNYLLDVKYNNFSDVKERENYQMKNTEAQMINNPSAYNATNNINNYTNVNENANVKNNETTVKTDLRANFINDVINEATRKGGAYGEKGYEAENSELYGRLNFNNNAVEPNIGLNDLTNNKKYLENLMNVNMNKNEEIERNMGERFDNIKAIKNKYLDTFYNNYVKTNNDLNNNEGNNTGINKNIDHANPYLGYRGGVHKRSSSSNVHIGKPEYEKYYNYLNFADDGNPKLKYFGEGEKGAFPNTLALDHYLQLKRAEEERIAKQQISDSNMNLKNRNTFDDTLGNNINNNATGNNAAGGMNIVQNNIKTGNDGNKDLRDFPDFDINDLRKKHLNLNLNSPPYTNDNPLEKEKNFLNRKENYLEDGNEMYNRNGINEKGKLAGIIPNYEDLIPFDKNMKKKGDFKSIVCVCQASKQMARLQIHMEENRHMLETERNLMKKRKENFEKKVEMLAEKEKEIEKIHLSVKEKEMSIEKKKNEIEEKEKYVSAIKNKYDNAQKELLEKMNECITIENKCKSKLYEYDEKFGQFNKKIKEMEEREKEIEEERRQIERKEKILNNNKQEIEEEKLSLLKEKNELTTLKKELENLEKEKKRMLENEYNNLHNKEEEVRRNERNAIMKEKELENRIDRYNDLIDELNKNKKEFEKDKLKLLDDLQKEKLKLLNEKKQFQMDLELEKNNLRMEKENEKNLMKEELKKERMSLMENIENEKKKAKEELEKERSDLHKTMEEQREKMNEDNEKLKNVIEQRYKENYENDKYRLEKKYEEEQHKLKMEFDNKANDLKHELENAQLKINKEKEQFEKQKQMYEEEFREKCEQYEQNIQKKYETLEEDKNKMKFLIMKEQEELENYKKSVYLDMEEEKEKLYVQEKKLNLEKENLLVEKEQIEIELKNYKNFKEKEENDIKIRIINLSQQQEDLNKEKENLEKEKEELEKRRISLNEKEECLDNDKKQIEESRQIFGEQLEKIKKDKEELLNYDKELQKREIHLIEKEKEHNKKEEELNKKQESLNSFDNELKEYSEKLQGREKKLKEKKNELQKVKDQLVNFKNSIKQKETQLQMIEAREKELLDEQTLIQIDRNSLEAEKKQFFLLKEKQQKDTDFIQEQLKLLHEQLKNKEKSLKEKENEINLLNKLQDCRNKSGKGTIISLKNPENPRMLSTNIPRTSAFTGRNKVKVKVIGKNKFDLMKKRNRKKSINCNYNNLDINNSIQYLDNMINENFKNKGRLQYQNDNLELSDANFIEEKNTSERQYPPRASILMNNVIDSDLLTGKIANLKAASENVNGMGMGVGMGNNVNDTNKEKNRSVVGDDDVDRRNCNEIQNMNKAKTTSKRNNNNGIINNNNDAGNTRLYEMNAENEIIPNAIDVNRENNYNYNEEKKGNQNFFRNMPRSEVHEDANYRNAYDDNFEKGSYISNEAKYDSNKKDLFNNKNTNYLNNVHAEQGFNSKKGRNIRNEGMYPYNNKNADERNENNNNNAIKNKKNAQQPNHRIERNELYEENNPNYQKSRMDKNFGKQQNGDYLSNKNTFHSNSYNINNAQTNIKMGSSAYNDISSITKNNTMVFDETTEQPEQQQKKNSGLMALDMNDLVTSEVINRESNYYDKGNVNDDGDSRSGRKGKYVVENGTKINNVTNNKNNMDIGEKTHLLEMGESQNNNMKDNMNYNISNGNERNNIKHNTVGGNTNTWDDAMGGGINTTKRNIHFFKNDKVKTTYKTNDNETPLHVIDNLVNKNMQSINHMSSLMISNANSRINNTGNVTNRKGSSNINNYGVNGVKGLIPMGNNYKNNPPNPKHIKKNRNDKIYNEEPLKKESNANEFLDEVHSEKYYYQDNNNDNSNMLSEPMEKNDTYYYNANNREKISGDDTNIKKNANKHFADSYDYNYNEGYEKDMKREEEDTRYIGGSTNDIDNTFSRDRYGHNRYEDGGTGEGEGRYANENTYNTTADINATKYENIKMMQDSGYNSDSNVMMYYGYEKKNDMKKTNFQQDANDYENESRIEMRNNSSSAYLHSMNPNTPQNNMPPIKNRNEENMSEQIPSYKNKDINVYDKKKMLPPTSSKSRNASKMNKLPPLRNKNTTLNNLRSFQMNNQNNTNVNGLGNINRKLQSRAIDPNLNKNMNTAKMKMLSDSVQLGNTNVNENKMNASSNSIIEQLDKTLLNKSIMLTNKNKKIVQKSEGNSDIRQKSYNKNTNIHSNLNLKQKGFYNSYNSDDMENMGMNQGQNKNQKNNKYDSYKNKNTLRNNNLLHMSSNIYESNIM